MESVIALGCSSAGCRHCFEMVAEGFDFRRDLGGTWRRFGFDGDQRGAEVFSLQTASGVFDQFAAEQPLGLIVDGRRSRGRASGAVSLASWSNHWPCRGCRQSVRDRRRFPPAGRDDRNGSAVVTKAG